MKRKRLIQVFIVVIVLILSVSYVSVATNQPPVLYKNDTKYTIDEYPAENVEGKIFVPINFFIGFDDIEYEYNNNPVGFYFRNENSGRYFSFSSSSTFIVVDGEFTDVTFPILNSTIYMPLDYCAKILSLEVEYKTIDSILRARVTDGTHKLGFEELIELYDPTEQPEDTQPTEPPTIVIPEIPSVSVPETPTPENRNLYITFDVTNGDYADSIFDLLEESGYKATFFFDAEAIRSSPQSVIRAFVEGHSIGISSTEETGLKETNDILYDVLHLYTRIARTKADTDNGYFSYPVNIDSESWSLSTERNIAKGIYNKTFEQSESVISIPTDEKSVGVTRQLLYYLIADEYATVLPIIPVAPTNTEDN